MFQTFKGFLKHFVNLLNLIPDSSFEDDTHSKFPYASTKAPADASQKEDEALGQILDDVLDMQAETEFYYDNVERIINELSRIEFLPWGTLMIFFIWEKLISCGHKF